MLKEKVLSILDHITNNHSFPKNSKHLKCSHGDLGPEELRTKPFISKNSASAKKLEKVLKGTNNSRYIHRLEILINSSELFQIGGFAHDGWFYTYRY